MPAALSRIVGTFWLKIYFETRFLYNGTEWYNIHDIVSLVIILCSCMQAAAAAPIFDRSDQGVPRFGFLLYKCKVHSYQVPLYDLLSFRFANKKNKKATVPCPPYPAWQAYCFLFKTSCALSGLSGDR